MKRCSPCAHADGKSLFEWDKRKNANTTVGFVRFSKNGEIEYIFVNPIFRKKGLAKKLLRLVRKKTGKNLVFQKPISPLGSKLLKSLEK